MQALLFGFLKAVNIMATDADNELGLWEGKTTLVRNGHMEGKRGSPQWPHRMCVCVHVCMCACVRQGQNS